jgi:hypothetical protein
MLTTGKCEVQISEHFPRKKDKVRGAIPEHNISFIAHESSGVSCRVPESLGVYPSTLLPAGAFGCVEGF